MEVGECREAEGRSHAALSVVNAIATGLGGAVSLDLSMKCTVAACRADVEGHPRAFVTFASSRVLGRSMSVSRKLRRAVETLFSLVAEQVRLTGLFLLSVSWESGFPAEAGLKSSSAVLSCVIDAVSKLVGVEFGIEEKGRMVARVSRREGLSITGAFDDAVATMGRGVFVTNNKEMRIMSRFTSGNLEALIAWKSSARPIERVSPQDFEGLAPLYRAVHALALRGRWLEAMLVNGILTSIAWGEGAEFIEEALRHGDTRAAGMTGKGPAMFAVGEGMEELARKVEDLGYRVLVSRLS